MARIYLASSWKNESFLLDLAKRLRKAHEVDCFCDPTDRYVFHWSEILDSPDKSKSHLDAITFLSDSRTQRAFREDKGKIDWADTIIMVLPCGNSAHLEAGYAKGCGKKLYILGTFPAGDFDVMYGFADRLFRFDELEDLENLLAMESGFTKEV